MTATDELRRMLDERGVEWSDRANVWTYETHWKGADGKFVRASQRADGIGDLVVNQHMTPAQAVEATLGPETCEWVYPQGANGWIGYAECSKCGYRVHDGTINEKQWMYCPNCGAKVCGRLVVDGGDGE